MTVKELYAYIEQKAPRALSAEWDNDGLACCVNRDRQIERVLVALDATEQVVQKAVEGRYDVLLTHHPLLFRGIKELTPEKPLPRKLLTLVLGRVAAMSFHTRLDAAEGGVNDVLCQLFGLTNIEKAGPEGEEMARVGTLPQVVSAQEFAQTVCEKLNTSAVSLIGERKTVKRIMVLGGEGADFVSVAAARPDVDLFLAGRIGYHRMLDAAEEGIALIEAGHFATERPVCDTLAAWVRQAVPTATVDVYANATIQLVTRNKQ